MAGFWEVLGRVVAAVELGDGLSSDTAAADATDGGFAEFGAGDASAAGADDLSAISGSG